MTAELVIRWSGGELDLMGWNSNEHGDFLIETLADGTDWGNPEPVRRALRRFLADGSSSVKEYDDNRTIPLQLRVKAADGVALAGGEQALDLLDGRRCELVWTPPDEFSAPAVFVLDYVDLRHKFDDFAEVSRRERFYSLTASAHPHAYSADWIEVPALPQTVSVRTEFDSCDSLTGWTSSGLTLSDAGSYIQIEYPAGVNGGTVTRTGAVDFTSTPYLAVTTSEGGVGAVTSLRVQVGSTWQEVQRVGNDAGAVLYHVGPVAVSAISWTYALAPYYINLGLPADAFASLGKQSTMRTAASNGHVRTIAVPGSRRTPATVEVSATTNLETVVLYSGPDYDPSLVTRLAPGSPGPGVSASSSEVSYPEEPETTYTLPISELPAGDYVVWAWVESDVAGPGALVKVQFTAELESATDGVVATAPLATVEFGHDPAGSLLVLFAATLPGFDVPPGSPHSLNLRLNLIDEGASVQFPWLWLFNVSEGSAPAIIQPVNARKMWISPPSLDVDHTSILVGNDERTAGYPVSANHVREGGGSGVLLEPGSSTIYLWSEGPTDATVSARFRAANHTHPTA